MVKKAARDQHQRNKEDSGDYGGRIRAKLKNIPTTPITGVDFTKLSTNEVLQRLTGNIEYKQEYAYYLLEHCQQGRSIITFPASYCLPFRLMQRWKEQHAEFAEAIQLAVSYELMYWESQLEFARDRDAIVVSKFRLDQINSRVKNEDLHRPFRETPPQAKDDPFSLDRSRDLGSNEEWEDFDEDLEQLGTMDVEGDQDD